MYESAAVQERQARHREVLAAALGLTVADLIALAQQQTAAAAAPRRPPRTVLCVDPLVRDELDHAFRFAMHRRDECHRRHVKYLRRRVRNGMLGPNRCRPYPAERAASDHPARLGLCHQAAEDQLTPHHIW